MVWYTGQFYALFFLQSLLRVDAYTANLLIAWSLLLGTGGFILFGWLSDKIGRKPIILAGCLIAALTYFPLFKALTATANPALHHAQQTVQVVVSAHPENCSFQFNPTGTAQFTSACDIAKATLARLSVNYRRVDAAPGTVASVRVGDRVIQAFDASALSPEQRAAETARFNRELNEAITAAGYPPAVNPSIVRMSNPFDIFRAQPFTIVMILTLLVIYVTMVYGPIAAALVELFPTRIRYSAMSLPYHIGNGWFGGLLPATSFAIVAQTGDIYAGLWYPIVVALMTVVIGLFFVPETKDRDILAEDTAEAPQQRPASASI